MHKDAQRLEDANTLTYINYLVISVPLPIQALCPIAEVHQVQLGVQARPANRCIRVSGTESIRAWQL